MDNPHSKEWKQRVRVRLESLRLLRAGQRAEDVAKQQGITVTRFYQRQKEFREKDIPFMREILAYIDNDKLLEEPNVSGQKAVLTKMKQAESGKYVASNHWHYRVKDGLIYENENTKIADKILSGFLKGDPTTSISRQLLSTSRTSLVRRILRDPVNKGEQVYNANQYKLDWQGWKQDPSAKQQLKLGWVLWKPRITPEQYDEIQSMITAPRKRIFIHQIYRLAPGTSKKPEYRLTSEGRKKGEKIVELRKQKMGYVKIGADKDIGWSPGAVELFLKDERITGKREADGKLVDSGFEPICDHPTWKALQEIKAPAAWNISQDRNTVRKRQIEELLPAYRWYIAEILGLSRTIVQNLVEQLINDDKTVKERPDDGLLQKVWKDFPQTMIPTRYKATSERRSQILEYVKKFGPSRIGDVAKAFDIERGTARHHLLDLKSIGELDREPRDGRFFVKSQIEKAD